MIQEQKTLLEQASQREKDLTNQLAEMGKQINTLPSTSGINTNVSNSTSTVTPEASASITAGNNPAGMAEVDVCHLQLQPVISRYSHPAKSGDPEKWINWYENETHDIRWTEQKRANSMVVYLEDQAAKWAINNKLTEWPAIKAAFISHFRSYVCERTEFDTFKFNHRGNLARFIEMKEEKAIAAGVNEEEAVQQTVLNGNIPKIFAFQLSDNLPKTFIDLKKRVNRMITIQQQSSPEMSHFPRENNYNNQQFRPAMQNRLSFRNENYKPAMHHKQSFRKVPYSSTRPSNQQSVRPTTPCPICAKENIISYHWVNECTNRQYIKQKPRHDSHSQPHSSTSKQVKTFEQQPQNDQPNENTQHPN